MISLPLKISGIVRHGKELGRTIGMPTVNLIPTEDAFTNMQGNPLSDNETKAADILSRLDFGVYFSETEFNEKTYKSITNVGIRPTVTEGRESSPAVTVETYIYDFREDVYGKRIAVTLLAFHRPEMRFSSVEELSAQMHADLEAGRNYPSP